MCLIGLLIASVFSVHPRRFQILPDSILTLEFKYKIIRVLKHFFPRWHLGVCNQAYLPIHRGFESYYGYWAGATDYYTKITGQIRAFDFHDGDDIVEDPEAKEVYSMV